MTRRAALKLVSPINIVEMERVVKEFAEQQAPMTSRSSALRQRMDMEAKAIEADIASLDEREAFIDRLYAALKQGFASDKKDLVTTLALYTGGLTQDSLSRGEAS